jgi:hypothetical protein
MLRGVQTVAPSGVTKTFAYGGDPAYDTSVQIS